MKAVCWTGVNQVRVEDVPEPRLLNPRDAIVRVKATTLCGSDLHLYAGHIPGMLEGDILGHEFMGEVVEVGRAVKSLVPGDRVVVPPIIRCGECFHCRRQQFSLCDNSNPKPGLAEKLWGHAACGTFGSSHLRGGYAGSHAEYVRVPFADVGPRKLPASISDEKALFLSDAVPTGLMAADLCGVEPGDMVAVWGAGAVGLFAIRGAFLRGASRVIAIDRLHDRLERARALFGAEVLDSARTDVVEALRELTGGRGPDGCIDAVGMDACSVEPGGWSARLTQALRPGRRRSVLCDAIRACRKGGTVAIVGLYGGPLDRFPMGAAVNKGLTLRMGQGPLQRPLDQLIALTERGELDPAVVVTHRMPLARASEAYALFGHRRDGCVRVVLQA
jgi:threonine dehydrogenase-like Zn-dependent dehydrogenase